MIIYYQKVIILLRLTGDTMRPQIIDKEVEFCPFCSSRNIEFVSNIDVIILLFECYDCGNEWVETLLAVCISEECLLCDAQECCFDSPLEMNDAIEVALCNPTKER